MKRSTCLAGFPFVSLVLAAVFVAATAAQLTGRAQAPQAAVAPVTRAIDYNWDVRPILSDNCFRCHGPDEKGRQANLRLDTPEGAYAALRRAGTFAIVPGKPEESQLIFRVTHGNAALRMPPRVANKVLSEQQIEILRAWIAQGAQYKPHWSFVAPQRASAMPQAPAGAARPNEIDRFVAARLQREGLQLSAEADKETLINRVTLTLTGLPPSLADVDAFLADTSPGAYDRLVDRLLASSAYGEHMAQQWLDVARYAESDGFLDDLHDRLFWPYRDWVIAALNRNMPFDQFATWQLAGDLLPNHTKEQELATAFLRVGKRSTENGAIDEEYRVEYAIDRAITVGTGFLAMTVGCARCHDHKYDPIPTSDFYSLTGFFNSVDEPGFYSPGRTGVTAGPTMLWTDEATEKKVADARAAVRRQETAYDMARQTAARGAAARAEALLADPAALAWAVRQSLEHGLAAYYPLEETGPIAEDQLPEPLPQARLAPPPLVVQTLEDRCTSNNGPLVSDEVCRERFRTEADEAEGTDGPRRLDGGLLRDELTVSPSAGGGAPPAVLMSATLREGVKGQAFYFTEDERGILGTGVGYYERTQPFSLDVWVKAAQVYDDSTILHHRETENAGNAGYELNLEGNHLRWNMMHARAGNGIGLLSKAPIPVGEWTHITVTYDGSSRAAGTVLYVNGAPVEVEVARDSLRSTIIPNGNANVSDNAFGLAFGKRTRAQTLKDGAIDEIRVFNTALTPLEVRQLHADVVPAAASAPLPAPTREDVVELLVAADAAVARAFAPLKQARDAENEIVSVIPEIMVMADLPTPRPTYVLVRGNYEDHGEQVPPRGLNEVLPWKAEWPENRLGLARWLFDPQHPLTARVYVNRVWQMHFGRGLVETSEDFGSQGSIPTHPDLLDDLAVQFIESGWDIKALHRTIVSSATYRQRSDASDELLRIDPRNMLLARYPRLRMPAEMVRDQALAASGLLVRTVGGPTVYPYQPPNLWDGFNVYTHPAPEDVPADWNHRRSVYSFIKRNSPHPAMASFDLPERGTAAARRPTSNSPLQALVLLDDPQFLEAYRALASHVLATESATDARLTAIFRLATRRHPGAEEMTTLRAYFESQVQRFSADRDAADALLAIGVTPVDRALDPVLLAALTNVTTVVMNTPDAYSLR